MILISTNGIIGVLYLAYRVAYQGPIWGPIGEKTEKLDFRHKKNILPHMAIQAVLA